MGAGRPSGPTQFTFLAPGIGYKMFGIETRVRMRNYLEQGLSKAATARLLGISRRTLYNWIEAGELERDPADTTVTYGPRAPRPTKIDPYKDHIAARLGDYPQLSAARLFREIRDDGYTGGYGQVKRYVRRTRGTIMNGEVAG